LGPAGSIDSNSGAFFVFDFLSFAAKLNFSKKRLLNTFWLSVKVNTFRIAVCNFHLLGQFFSAGLLKQSGLCSTDRSLYVFGG
jgi:hypothetical protein